MAGSGARQVWLCLSFCDSCAEGQESDPRVLKAQLTLAATAARNTRITSPVWALACAILCSVGLFGHVSFASHRCSCRWR